jgi:dihydropteroate synthase
LTGGHGAERLIWRLRDTSIDVTQGLLMGVINVTPDSFSDGGLNLEADAAVSSALDLHRVGAGIIDVGGESTRPGAEPVEAGVEIARVLPVVERLVAEGIVVSVDTSKAEVARAAVAAGAQVVNDVTASSDPEMAPLLAELGVGVVLMHSSGEPRTMQEDPRYDDVVAEVAEFLDTRARSLIDAGVDPAAIVVDPGIGFGKTVTHNLELIAGLESLAELGYPVVLGASRKSFLGAVTGIEEASARDGVTAVTTALGFERGARIFRVHDVATSRVALAVVAAIVNPQQWDEWSQG